MEKRSFKNVAIFRIPHKDKEALEQIANRLGLNEFEIGRRAMRLELQILNEADLPGAKIELRMVPGRESSG